MKRGMDNEPIEVQKEYLAFCRLNDRITREAVEKEHYKGVIMLSKKDLDFEEYEVKIWLNAWQKVNPNATESQVREWLRKIGGEKCLKQYHR